MRKTKKNHVSKSEPSHAVMDQATLDELVEDFNEERARRIRAQERDFNYSKAWPWSFKKDIPGPCRGE